MTFEDPKRNQDEDMNEPVGSKGGEATEDTEDTSEDISESNLEEDTAEYETDESSTAANE